MTYLLNMIGIFQVSKIVMDYRETLYAKDVDTESPDYLALKSEVRTYIICLSLKESSKECF